MLVRKNTFTLLRATFANDFYIEVCSCKKYKPASGLTDKDKTVAIFTASKFAPGLAAIGI